MIATSSVVVRRAAVRSAGLLRSRSLGSRTIASLTAKNARPLCTSFLALTPADGSVFGYRRTPMAVAHAQQIRSLSSADDLPYHIVMGMPALSPTMESGTISKWNVAEGDTFSAGDSLAVIETDKASMDFEAQDDGVVAKILVPEGGVEINVNDPIIVTVEEEGDVAAFKDFAPAAAPAEDAAVAESAPAAAPAAAPATPAADLPEHIVMGMPALSPTMDAGTISKWNVAEGDSFSAGDSLAVIETDKASMDFEAQDDGIVAKILVAEGGSEVAVGMPVIVTVEEEGDVGAFANFVPESVGGAPESAPADAVAAEPAAPAPVTPAAPAPTAAPTPAPVPVASEVAPPAAAPATPLGGGAPWGRLASERSPLANLLAAKHKDYIKTYGSTGHSPIA